MGGVARCARGRPSGHRLRCQCLSADEHQLEAQGIELIEGFEAASRAEARPVRRRQCRFARQSAAGGHPRPGCPMFPGPQWLAEHVLRGRWVLAVAGTHGKTTTSSMLAWILEDAGLKPGLPDRRRAAEFRRVGAAGRRPFFVIEADEYDTAFCDKRSKFVHYRPRTAILNNLEFDHADIFADLAAIETQFHHLVRTLPVRPDHRQWRRSQSAARAARGCWSESSGSTTRRGLAVSSGPGGPFVRAGRQVRNRRVWVCPACTMRTMRWRPCWRRGMPGRPGHAPRSAGPSRAYGAGWSESATVARRDGL
jgi:UDP-N-acetylmuramate: L-alanyl-gamma-D-glutamyl-meso-diaminopimelate ligase